jgi:hypothetical protein
MTNQLPYEGPADDPDMPLEEVITGDDDRPLDPDAADDRVDSAEADERAATQGEIDVDELP